MAGGGLYETGAGECQRVSIARAIINDPRNNTCGRTYWKFRLKIPLKKYFNF